MNKIGFRKKKDDEEEDEVELELGHADSTVPAEDEESETIDLDELLDAFHESKTKWYIGLRTVFIIFLGLVTLVVLRLLDAPADYAYAASLMISGGVAKSIANNVSANKYKPKVSDDVIPTGKG